MPDRSSRPATRRSPGAARRPSTKAVRIREAKARLVRRQVEDVDTVSLSPVEGREAPSAPSAPSVAATPEEIEAKLFADAARAAHDRHVAAGRIVTAWNERGEAIGTYAPDGSIIPLAVEV